MNKYEIITPGEILLEEFIKPLGISQNQLAISIGVPANRINQIVNSKREITADTAIRLSIFFHNSPEFWMKLQMQYNLYLEKQNFEIIKSEVKINN